MQRFDIWYWRKYRRNGPLCEGVFRIQTRILSWDRTKRNKIFLVAGVFLLVWYFYRLELI